jgi:hypothetical protein
MSSIVYSGDSKKNSNNFADAKAKISAGFASKAGPHSDEIYRNAEAKKSCTSFPLI